MTSFMVKITQLAGLKFLKRNAQVLFSKKYLLITNTCISVCMSGTGDMLQQRYEIIRKRQKKWDPVRSRHVCTTGLLIGPSCHFWYLFLDRVFPGRGAFMLVKKVLVDQAIFAPVNISLFLVTLGILEGMSRKEVWDDLKHKGQTLLTAEWIVGPPAQLVNFYFLPTKYRVLYDHTISLGFDFFYSYVKYSKDKKNIVKIENINSNHDTEIQTNNPSKPTTNSSKPTTSTNLSKSTTNLSKPIGLVTDNKCSQ